MAKNNENLHEARYANSNIEVQSELPVNTAALAYSLSHTSKAGRGQK